MKEMRVCYKSIIVMALVLKNIGYPDWWITYAVDHEKDHFEMARKLGYNVSYGIHFKGSWPYSWEDCYPYLHFDDQFVKLEDLVLIAFAPKEPSEGDIKTIERIKRMMRNLRYITMVKVIKGHEFEPVLRKF